MEKKVTYFFGRIHFSKDKSILDYHQDKNIKINWIKKRLEEFFENFRFLRDNYGKKFEYKIGGLEYTQNEDVLIAKFVRIKHSDLDWDEVKKDTIKKEGIGDVEQCYFFIHIPTLILGYEEFQNLRGLVNIFKQEYKRQFQNELGIDLFKKDDEALRIINSYKVNQARLNFEPTNPNPFGDTKKAEDFLLDLNAGRVKLEPKVNSIKKEQGLNFSVGSFLRNTLALCHKAYGKYKLFYVDGKVVKEFDSEKNLVKKKVKIYQDNEKKERIEEYYRLIEEIRVEIEENDINREN
ncbi:MAG: hypothetical protein ACLFPL_03045 [Candidatus Nanoarchaeia archaeon]